MELITLSVDQIDASDRLRPIDEDFATLIGASMAQNGQHHPVQVLPARPDGLYPLISGGHRWRGAQIHGLPLLAMVQSIDQLQAELLEIDENLMSHRLNPLDEAVFLLARKDVYERLYPETRHGAAKKKDDKLCVFVESFAEATAEKLGLSRRSIELRVQRAAQIAPSVLAMIAGTWLARAGTHLDALVKLKTAELQSEVVTLLLDRSAAGETLTVRQAQDLLEQKPLVRHDPITKAHAKLLTAWERSPREARVLFADDTAALFIKLVSKDVLDRALRGRKA